MRLKPQIVDSLQNIMIAALMITAVLLFAQASFFDSGDLAKSFGSIFGGSSSPAGIISVGDVEVDAAQPLYVIVTAETGAHYAAKLGEARDELISRFAATVGEAIGSATEREHITQEDFQSAARGAGVFFDYVFDQSLEFIAQSLGTTCPDALREEIPRRLMLSISSGSLYLYYAGDEGFYRCHTASDPDSLSAKIAECPIGIAQFAFELGDAYENLDPYFVFTNETVEIPDVAASNPALDTHAGKELLACFGINIGTCSDHTEANGSTVYVDSDKSLRFGIDGYLIFTVSGSGGMEIAQSGSEPTIAEMLTSCARLAKSIFSYFKLDPVLAVTGIDRLEDGSLNIAFGRLENGVPVKSSGSLSVADFSISDGKITHIEIILRRYDSSSTGASSPLPEKLTAAIAGINGGEPVLVYVDDNMASPTVAWTSVS